MLLAVRDRLQQLKNNDIPATRTSVELSCGRFLIKTGRTRLAWNLCLSFASGERRHAKCVYKRTPVCVSVICD